MLYEKVQRQKLTMMTILQNIDERGANDPACHPLCWASDTCARIIFIYLVLVSLLLFLSILLNVNNGNTKQLCKIYWHLTGKVPERPQWLRICVFIANLEHISPIVLVCPLLADIEQVNIDWESLYFRLNS